MTTGRRATVGGPLFPPLGAANAASISGQSMPREIGTPAADDGVVPGRGPDRTEERHVGPIEPLAAGELLTPQLPVAVTRASSTARPCLERPQRLLGQKHQ